MTLIAEVAADLDCGTAPLDSPSALVSPSATRPSAPIRLRRPPASEPPYDSPEATSASHTTASWPRQRSVDGFAPPAHPIGGVVPASHGGTSSMRQVSTAAATAQRYVRICLEVLNGFRSAAHLRTLTGPVEFGAVVNQLSRRRNGCGHFPQAAAASPAAMRSTRPSGGQSAERRLVHSGTAAFATTRDVAANVATFSRWQPSQTARRNAPGAAQPYRLVRLRVTEPRDGVAEVAVVLSFAGTSLAVALRLERRADQWICAVAQVI